MAAAAVANPFHYAVGEAAGIKVASRDDGGPTTNLAVVVRGGSRYETAPGVAHALEKFAFKVGPADKTRRGIFFFFFSFLFLQHVGGGDN